VRNTRRRKMTLTTFNDSLNYGLCMAEEGNIRVYWGRGSDSVGVVTSTYQDAYIRKQDVPTLITVLKYLCEEEWNEKR
jgi:hypothetical protein